MLRQAGILDLWGQPGAVEILETGPKGPGLEAGAVEADQIPETTGVGLETGSPRDGLALGEG